MFTTSKDNKVEASAQLGLATGAHDTFSFQSPGSTHSDAKFLWIAAGCLILVLCIGGLVFRQLTAQFEDLDRQRRNVVRSLGIVNGLDEVRERSTIAMRNASDYIRIHDPSLLSMYEEAKVRMPESFTRLQVVVDNDVARKQFSELRRAAIAQMDFIEKMVNVAIRGEMDNATFSRMMAERAKLVATTIELSTKWRQQQIDMLTNGDLLADQQLVAARNAALKSLVAGVLLILILAWLLLGYIRRREHSEQQLRLASKLWKGTLETLSQGVGMYHRSGRLILWNARFCEVHSVPAEKMYSGMGYDEVIRSSTNLSPSGVERALASATAVIKAANDGESLLFERQRDDGALLQIAVQPMNRDFYVVTLTDISDIRRSEQTARDQAARLSTIMNNVPDAIVTIDEQGSVESWNEGAQKLFGYSSEEILHRNVDVLMHDNLRDESDYLHWFFDAEEPRLGGRRREWEARHKDGGIFPVDFGVGEMHVGGRRMFVGIVRDITERRVVERLKNEFVATVSHELRTPLTSIAGSLSLLSSGAGGELPAKAQRLMEIAHKNSERLTVLINDILDLEKSESGKLELKIRPQTVIDLVLQALEVNRAYAQQFQVRFELRNLMHGDATVLVDEARIMQVLANFLSNAAKFSPHGGQVMIQLEQIEAAVRVSVHDDGPGIPTTFRDRIFTRFAQADASDTRKKGGTGLGLAIAKSLVEHHHGRVGFESGQSVAGDGQGATFWFELPMADTSVDHLDAQRA